MAASGNGGRPLVADRRYAAAKAAPKKTAPPPKPAKRSKPPARRGLFMRLILWIWRLVWGVTWRVSLVAGLALGGVVAYFYQQLPEVEALLDGRAKGSVTLLDRNDTVLHGARRLLAARSPRTPSRPI